MKKHESFNKSGFSRFLNTPAGRVMRMASGLGFLIAGFAYRKRKPGVASMLWSMIPLSAGVFDLCYISGLLGGPLKGKEIRSAQISEVRPSAT